MDRFKTWVYQRKVKVIIVILIITICFQIVRIVPQDLMISFLDVGQGDATLITTPMHKTILVDGGGSSDKEKYDVGKRVLLPYLLKHQIKKIDIMIISHFDVDHVRTDY